MVNFYIIKIDNHNSLIEYNNGKYLDLNHISKGNNNKCKLGFKILSFYIENRYKYI